MHLTNQRSTIRERLMTGITKILLVIPGIRFVPNGLTLSRYILAPIAFYMMMWGDLELGSYLMVIAYITDGLDGFIARAANCVTKWGEQNDPPADHIAIGLTIIWVFASPISWIVKAGMVLIILRHLSVWKISAVTEKLSVKLPVTYWGKASTAFQMTAMGFLLLFPNMPVFEPLFAIGFVLCMISGAGYFFRGKAATSQGRALQPA